MVHDGDTKEAATVHGEDQESMSIPKLGAALAFYALAISIRMNQYWEAAKALFWTDIYQSKQDAAFATDVLEIYIRMDHQYWEAAKEFFVRQPSNFLAWLYLVDETCPAAGCAFKFDSLGGQPPGSFWATALLVGMAFVYVLYRGYRHSSGIKGPSLVSFFEENTVLLYAVGSYFFTATLLTANGTITIDIGATLEICAFVALFIGGPTILATSIWYDLECDRKKQVEQMRIPHHPLPRLDHHPPADDLVVIIVDGERGRLAKNGLYVYFYDE
jgi:hypothetical protein